MKLPVLIFRYVVLIVVYTYFYVVMMNSVWIFTAISVLVY